MIKIKANFTEADIAADIKEWQEAAWKIMLIEFQKIALEAVTEARIKSRSTGGFDDQTGNLRASMGYIIMFNGKRVDENFEGAPVGTQVGKKYSLQVAKDYPKGWAIIIVAGMEYASYVEALNYDVITGSTLGMKLKVDQAMKNVEKAMKNFKPSKKRR